MIIFVVMTLPGTHRVGNVLKENVINDKNTIFLLLLFNSTFSFCQYSFEDGSHPHL